MGTRLRELIQTRIGRGILDKYCQRRGRTSGPIMIPPIPDSKFLEKLPENVVLDKPTSDEKGRQNGYIAEVKFFRCLEEVDRDIIVVHQLEYTHEQYSAFKPDHQCNQKKCWG